MGAGRVGGAVQPATFCAWVDGGGGAALPYRLQRSAGRYGR